MKKIPFLILLCLLITGCTAETAATDETVLPTESLQLGNPWKSYGSLEAAEAACGLDFPLEETVAGSYRAETFRVMNGELLEITYRDDSFDVTVRMKAGEDDDISGVYAQYSEIHTFEEAAYTMILKYIQNGGSLQLISKDGHSYSFYAPNHYWGDSNADFLAFLNE